MTRRPGLLLGVGVGLLLSAPLIAVQYLGSQVAGLPFTPFDLFDWVTRILPGPVVTFGIDAMIDTLLALGISVAEAAKTAEQSMAVGMALAAGVLAGGVFFAVLARREPGHDSSPGLILGGAFGLIAALLSLSGQSRASPAAGIVWVTATFLGWGVALAWAHRSLSGIPQPAPAADAPMSIELISRRRFLIRAGAAAAAITVVGTGLGVALATRARRRQEAARLAALPTHEAESIDPAAGLPNAGDPVMPVPGTRPEITPVEDHYRVFIRTLPSAIDPQTWRLAITGMVENPLTLSLDDLWANYEPIHRYVTLSCISNRVGGDLIGTTLWTGASFKQVLADAGVQPGARYVVMECDDGFYETIDLDLVNSDERIMLTYNWDGRPLPHDHGAPLRLYIPDRFGMKQPKWITSMRVTDTYEEGYWVERGWSEVAQMRATSVIDVVAIDDTIERDGLKFIPIGGIAHAGARGISKVEVRVDGGPWQGAQLRAPLSDTTWVVWRFEWPFAEGNHVFEVRCFEGDGTPQIAEVNPPRPDGATGIHSLGANI